MAEQNDQAGNINQQRKFRISPLNFATAFFFIAAAYLFITGVKVNGMPSGNWGATIAWIFILFGFVVSFLDLIFRNFFTITKNLWIVELSFITLVLIIFFLVK